MKHKITVVVLSLLLPLLTGSSYAASLYYSSFNIAGPVPAPGGRLFKIDSATGNDALLLSLGATDFNDLAGSPIADTIYAMDISHGGGCLDTVNVVSLLVQLVGCTGIGIQEIGYDSNHNILYGTNIASLYSINQTSGAATLIGSFGGPNNMEALTYDGGTNTLYGVDDTTHSLYTINTSTGAATLVGITSASTVLNVYDIWVDPATGQMFGVGLSAAGTTPTFFSLNKATGAASIVKAGTIDVGIGLAAPLVLSTSAPVPTLSERAILLLIALFLGFGALQLRRRAG
jgi:hypothetical protein